MSEQDPNRAEIRRIQRVLREMLRMARFAVTTGGMERGARQSAQQYNQCLQRLEQLGAVPAGFFVALPPEVSFEEVGAAAAHLASYVGDDEEPGRPGPGS